MNKCIDTGTINERIQKIHLWSIKKGSRAKDYELALSWLVDCGLVNKVCRVSKPGIPLKAYEDISAFKLFIADVGILGARGDIDFRTCHKYSPSLAIRTSISDYREEEWMTNLQLYSINEITQL